MIRLIEPYKGNQIGEILSLGCVQENKLIEKGIAIKLKIPEKNYVVKG
jgi:hypothetical protein